MLTLRPPTPTLHYTTSLMVLSIWWEPVLSVVFDAPLPYNIFSIIVGCVFPYTITSPTPPKNYNPFQSKFGETNIGCPSTCIHCLQPHPLLQRQYRPRHFYVCMSNICPPHPHHRVAATLQISFDFYKSYKALITHAMSLLLGGCPFNILPQHTNSMHAALQAHFCTDHRPYYSMASTFFPQSSSATCTH